MTAPRGTGAAAITAAAMADVTAAGPTELTGRAPAKVNLGLAVTGQRPDGYHELDSVFLRLRLADVLRIEVERPGDPDRLTIGGDPDCPVEGNLVLRALVALRGAVPGGAGLPGLAIVLDKRIPMGAGLAGGSSDAATTLRLAAFAWGLAAADVDLMRLGAGIGADVPFFAADRGAAVVRGVGERITPLPALRTRVGVLLVTPPFGMASPDVFRAFDRELGPGPAAARTVEALALDWGAGLDGPALAEHSDRLRDANDLWAAVASLEPRMARLREGLEAVLDQPVLLTGSGSTLVALYPSLEAARAAAARLSALERADLADVRVTATTDDHPDDEDDAR